MLVLMQSLQNHPPTKKELIDFGGMFINVLVYSLLTLSGIELEDKGALDSLNEVDLYCLHFVLPEKISSQRFAQS